MIDSAKTESVKVSVLFVCLGNICRSPTAHSVFEHVVAERGLSDKIQVDSCGTGDWHIGHAPDPRAVSAAERRGYDLSSLRARQLDFGDFLMFDYILAMDNANLYDINQACPADFEGHLSLFLDFADDAKGHEVPDPYYGGEQGFNRVIDMIERAAHGLLDHIVASESY